MPADASDWTAFDAAFDRALSLDGLDRDVFLASLDEATRARLGPLLADALRDDPLFDRPDVALETLAEALAHDRGVHEGERIGPYRIKALVGEGGMGRVYRAHRADAAFEQTVAVKVVRQSLALAGSDVSARLRRERDLLAALDHPGIARLVDGGETDDGVPYLVTEFVDGAPVTDWADAHGLDVEARVRLLIDVARAIDHAHRRFVVHRDLKPSNVLVAERDGAARPVVLDFGIAKLLDVAEADGSGAFPLTRTGMRLLTPAYAAPELYDPTATVTTAADVYGLGALLYEVLTGRRPHDDIAAAGPATTEPTRPSKAVLTQADGAPAAPSVASRSRSLQGDLDTICLKALHPDPARRYASASNLADDLGRHLSGRPVEARPDSVAYIAGRFVRRNRGAVVAGGLALVAGLMLALFAFRQERAARADAEVAAARAAEAADLLAGLFRTANPDYDGGRDVTVRDLVAEGVTQVDQVESAPLRAFLLRVLGETYIQLGEPVRADSLLQEALALHGTEATGDEPTRVRWSLLATRDALSDPRRVLALSQRLARDHPGDHATEIRADIWASRALGDLGRHPEAVAVARRALVRAQSDGSPSDRVRCHQRLGDALAAARRFQEALPHLEAAVETSRLTFGDHSGQTSSALSSLGYAQGQAGDVAGAEASLREAIAFHAARYGAERIGYPLAALGEAFLVAGRYRRAAAVLDSAATMGAAIVGDDHLDVRHWRALQAEALGAAEASVGAGRASRPALRGTAGT